MVEAEKDEEEDTEGEKFSFDESVNIEESVFLDALYKIVSELKEQNKHSLVSILKPDNSKLEHNRWTLIVANEISRKQMEMERDVVAQLRDLVKTPNLFLEIEVKEHVNTKDAMPYTNTEKLEMMRKKNPDIDKLLKKFDAILDYRA